MLRRKKLITVPVDREQMSQRNRALAKLLELSDFLASQSGKEQVISGGLGMVHTLLNAEGSRLYLSDPRHKRLKLAAALGLDTKGLESMAFGEGFSGKAAAQGSFLAQRVQELENRKRRERLSGLGLKSIVCVPLIASGRLVGVINLGARRLVRLDWATIDLLILAGNLLAVAIQNALRAQELEDKARILGDQKDTIAFFAYTASHDLKNPALAIHGLARLLLQRSGAGLDPRARETCRQIERAAARLEALIGEINGFIKSKEAPLRLEKFAVRDVLKEVRSSVAAELESRKVRWQTPPRLPRLTADRLALTRVFQNLVENALKHAGPDLSKISVGYRRDGEHHVFSVADNGIGLEAGGSETVFDLFSRGPSQSSGSGLGLSIVRTVAQRHGGRAWLESRPGRGCAFYFSLLRAPA